MGEKIFVIDLGSGKAGWYVGEKSILGNPYLKTLVIVPIGSFRKDYIDNVDLKSVHKISSAELGSNLPYSLLMLVIRPGPLMNLINSEYSKMLENYSKVEREKQIAEQLKKDLELSAHLKELSEWKRLKKIHEETKPLVRKVERRY